MDKILQKLDSTNKELDELKQVHHSKGSERLYDIHALLERVINRIYPEKDAKRLISSMYAIAAIATDDDAYHQRDFLQSIDRSKRTIKTIKEEFELFGFDDFKPIKEKIETEVGVKAGIFNLKRKKTKEDK